MSGSASSEFIGIGDADGLRLSHTGTAVARTVVAFRHSFSQWLELHLELSEERVADVVLATDEAMSNCADHAYRVTDDVGNMTLEIAYYPVTRELKVCVVDHGRWLEPDFPPSTLRGRGIHLMHALADDCTIDGGREGTTVRLCFGDCSPKSFVLSQAS
ncbi:ATP-binding protein [Mycobacterium sp. ML4]